MTFQPAPNCAKVALVHAHLSSLLVNVFHFRRTGQWGISELDDLLQAVSTAWVNDVMVHISEVTGFLRAEGRGLRAQADVSSERVLPQPVQGGRSGQTLPANVSFAVTHVTGLTGRANRGRTFFGALARSDVINDTLVNARAAGFQNGLNSVRNAANQAGWTMVVLSRTLNKQRRAEAVPVDIIGFRYRDLTLDSQRRRLTARGT